MHFRLFAEPLDTVTGRPTRCAPVIHRDWLSYTEYMTLDEHQSLIGAACADALDDFANRNLETLPVAYQKAKEIAKLMRTM